MKSRLVLLLCLIVFSGFAGQHTNYTDADLQASFTNSSLVAGDIEWVTGRTYFPVMRISQLSGTNIPLNGFGWLVTVANSSATMIEFRSLPGQVAKIDRPVRFASGGGIRFRDIEFIDSLKGFNPGNPSFSYPAPWIHFDSSGGYANEFVNDLVHDVNDCWGGLAGARKISGTLTWYVGSYYYEHGVYPWCTNYLGNISLWTSGSTIQLGTEGGLMNVSSNIASGTSILGNSPGNEQPEFLLVYGGVFADNVVYEPAGGNGTALHHNGGTFRAHRNKIAAYAPMILAGSANVSNTNNSLYMQGYSSAFYALARNGNSSGTWVNNANNYYSIGVVHFNNTNTSRTFAQWKSDYAGFDTTSTSSDSTAMPDSITVIPNTDETKRCHIAIFNGSLADNVSVTPGVLNVGDTYRLYSAQNYGAGPIRTGTFTGTAISVPMTNLTSAPILYDNVGLTQPAVTSPTFAAFVLIGSAGPSINGTFTINGKFDLR